MAKPTPAAVGATRSREPGQSAITDLDAVNFYTDESVVNDPNPYYDGLRAKCPVLREPHFDTMMVTGLEEGLEVYRQGDAFSSCLAMTGPIPGLPFKPEGDDISRQIEQHRRHLPWSTHFVTFDEPEHTAHRTLLTRLLTGERLKKSEQYIHRVVAGLIDRLSASERCEIVSQFAYPMTTLVVLDLLGVPEEDREEFLVRNGAPAEDVGSPEHKSRPDPMQYLERRFAAYLEERQREPRNDMMSELASSRFRDGSRPDLAALVQIATFLFVAGQDTASKLIASSFRILGDCAHLQQRLRAEPHRIPDFIEEVLRTEAPAKVNFRVARRPTSVGGVNIPAGTLVAIALGAANRDPRHFEEPGQFRLDRANVRDHIAFGRGYHACPGAPLARLEAQITLEHFLDRMSDIRICESKHGPANARRYHKAPTYILNGLMSLHLELTRGRNRESACPS